MSGDAAVWFVAGIALGFVAASMLVHSSASDARVAKGVRDKVASNLGEGVASVGDALGLWPYTVGLAGLTQ